MFLIICVCIVAFDRIHHNLESLRSGKYQFNLFADVNLCVLENDLSTVSRSHGVLHHDMTLLFMSGNESKTAIVDCM